MTTPRPETVGCDVTVPPCHTLSGGAGASRTCPGCGRSLEGRAPQVRTCSSRCRQRVHRDPSLLEDADYVVTDEDRAAIRRVLERDGHGHPGPVLTVEQVRAHVAATATRT